MIKVSFCMRRLPHLTREEFLKYWREKHPFAVGPEAVPALGIKRYVQLHTIDTPARDLIVGSREGLEEEFDGVAELWLDSVEALERDWSSAEGKAFMQAFIDDEKNFVDWSRSTTFVSEEHPLIS